MDKNDIDNTTDLKLKVSLTDDSPMKKSYKSVPPPLSKEVSLITTGVGGGLLKLERYSGKTSVPPKLILKFYAPPLTRTENFSSPPPHLPPTWAQK